MNEAEFQRQVVKAARDHGWFVCHVGRAQVRPGRTITPATRGFPDLVLVKPPRVVFLELKGPDGKPRPEQLDWIGALQRCTEVEAWFASPADTDDVLAILTEPL